MLCKICQNSTISFFNAPLSKHYFYCSVCEFISIDPSFIVNLEREKAQYENHHNSLENEGYVKMFEDFMDLFWDMLPCKEIHALDFGSGPTPVLAELLKKRGAKVDCYDKFYQPQTLFEDKTYDLITSTEVFEHLENPLQTLEMLVRYLKPNGIIAIMTLFHPNDTELFIKWWYPRDPTHISFFTCKTLEILGKKCNLKIVGGDGKRVVFFKKVATIKSLLLIDHNNIYQGDRMDVYHTHDNTVYGEDNYH